MSKSVVRDQVRDCVTSMLASPKNQVSDWRSKGEGVLLLARELGIIDFSAEKVGGLWLRAATGMRLGARVIDIDQEYAMRCQFDECFKLV